MTTDEIMEIVLAADPNASRYFSEETGKPYTCWHEFSRDPLWGDDDVAEDGWRFQVDRFSVIEDDPVAGRIWQVLRQNKRVSVFYTILFEKESGYIHHVFTCRGR